MFFKKKINNLCPFLNKQCANNCSFYKKWKTVDTQGKEKYYWNCIFNQIPILLVENNSLLRELNRKIEGGQNEKK